MTWSFVLSHEFKELLLADATAAAAELGIAASNATTTVSATACRPRFLLTAALLTPMAVLA